MGSRRFICGSFSSRSCSLALKPSLKGHQMTTLYVQDDRVLTQMMLFSLKLLFLEPKNLSFDDLL